MARDKKKCFTCKVKLSKVRHVEESSCCSSRQTFNTDLLTYNVCLEKGSNDIGSAVCGVIYTIYLGITACTWILLNQKEPTGDDSAEGAHGRPPDLVPLL